MLFGKKSLFSSATFPNWAWPIFLKGVFRQHSQRVVVLLFYTMPNDGLTVLQVTGQVTQYRPRLRPGKVSMIP